MFNFHKQFKKNESTLHSLLNNEKCEALKTTTYKKSDERHPVLTSLPNLNIEPHMKMYPWHLKISIDSKLDFSKTEKLKEEFALQYYIERKLTDYFESKCKVKKIVSYHKNDQSIHHWYINCCEVEHYIVNDIEFDDIKKERNINLEFNNDENWDEVTPIIKSIKESFLDYNTIMKHFEGD